MRRNACWKVFRINNLRPKKQARTFLLTPEEVRIKIVFRDSDGGERAGSGRERLACNGFPGE
jgi:hypothetical protein